MEDYLMRAEGALLAHDGAFFAAHLPQREYWRVYREFKKKTLFLDIETTGLSRYYDKITLVGTFDGKAVKVFVRDNNLDELPGYLENYEVLVTFNGKQFDVPFMLKELPELRIPPIHIDLRFLLKSIGITGPLKKIERKLGLQRPEDVHDIDGRGAAVLWSMFLSGDDEAFKKLLLYNVLDVVNLPLLLHHSCRQKAKHILGEMNGAAHQLGFGESPREKKATYYIRSSSMGSPEITTKHKRNNSIDAYLNGRRLITISRDRVRRTRVAMDSLIAKVREKGYLPVSVGIDLTGSEKRASGFCVLRGTDAHLDLVLSDDEIVSKTIDANPTIVSIDSPLSLPAGRCCTKDSCECRRYGIMRECERILKKRGVNVYPSLIPSMQKLTARGMKLAGIFEKAGYDVIESYPGAAQDIMGLPRKRVNLRQLETDLMNLGAKPICDRPTITHDEIDALTSAMVGHFYLSGKYEAIGNPDEGYLIIPEFEPAESL